MRKNFNLLTTSFIFALTSALPQLSHAVQDENPFDDVGKDIQRFIVIQAASMQLMENESPANIALVCKEWREIIKEEKENLWKVQHGIPGNEAIYERFLNGELVYRPELGSDKGMIRLPISGLTNPLEGTFDLSQCGNAATFLSIATGYHTEQNRGDKKLDVWISPKFLLEKKRNARANPFKNIMDKWDKISAPVGIFFSYRWASFNAYAYLISESVESLSGTDFYDLNTKLKVSKSMSQLPNILWAPPFFIRFSFEFPKE